MQGLGGGSGWRVGLPGRGEWQHFATRIRPRESNSVANPFLSVALRPPGRHLPFLLEQNIVSMHPEPIKRHCMHGRRCKKQSTVVFETTTSRYPGEEFRRSLAHYHCATRTSKHIGCVANRRICTNSKRIKFVSLAALPSVRLVWCAEGAVQLAWLSIKTRKPDCRICYLWRAQEAIFTPAVAATPREREQRVTREGPR